MSDLIFPSQFMPHGQCYLWESGLLWSHVLADLIIVLAYFSIPFFLFYIVKKREDIQFGTVFYLFGLFILLCGATHLIAIVTVWKPLYWLSAYIKALTAIVSIFTAYFLWRLIPQILIIPSPSQLKKVNEQLKDEIVKHEITEQELKKFSLAIEYSPNLVMITNYEGNIEYCNPAMYKVTGYEKDELIGYNPRKMMSNLTSKETYQHLWGTIRQGRPWQGELLDRKKNGELFWCLHSIASIKNNLNQITHYVSVAHDITDRKDSEELIKSLAYYDPLTHLPNRTLFQERMERAIISAKRNKRIFALIYLDLDRFKSINDTLGHVIGDKLLIEVGKRIKAVLRERETIARLGGDEFAIILSDIDKPESAGFVAEKILKQFSTVLNLDNHELFISTSLGIAIFPNDADNIEALTKDADTALYHAKDQGRGRYAFFDKNLEEKNIRHLEIEMGLRKAISENELSLLYQPKLDAKTGKLVGVEALLRWRNEKLGQVSPVEFIEIAEHTGQIEEIGNWVLCEVCRQINLWSQHLNSDLPVSINLSARQFKQDTLLSSIERHMQEFAVNPAALEFEITESAIMDEPAVSLAIMQEFNKKGLKLAIDDFGTGYSSLAYLKRFPAHTLKIDRSFIHDIAGDKGDAAIVTATISLAHNLGLKVVAEGVENKVQAEFLTKHGCDELQGFFFHEPLTADEIVANYGLV